MKLRLLGCLSICVSSALAVEPSQPTPTLPNIQAVEFTATAAPASDWEMTHPYSRSKIIIQYDNGELVVQSLSYHTLFRAGDTIGKNRAGTVIDHQGKPIEQSPIDVNGHFALGPFYANGADANSLLQVQVQNQTHHYLITHFEYHPEAPAHHDNNKLVELYGKLPASMALTRLARHPSTNLLTAVDLHSIDMSPIHGLWIACAASITPWHTHLGGEEYEPDAMYFHDQPLPSMNLYLGTMGKLASEGGANAYHYGYKVEVSINQQGVATPIKRYAMGRLSSELGLVMPDNRTVYMGDDGRDTVMFMFIADQPKDLSTGQLYAAKWQQVSDVQGGQAQLDWIPLGHASEQQIESLIAEGITFGDIFDDINHQAYRADMANYPMARPIQVYPGFTGSPPTKPQSTLRYLSLKPGMAQAAAFLESRRYAAYRGATTEFTKMEGMAVNAADRKLYIAMASIEKGMIDGQNTTRPQDHIHLAGNANDLACGAVYEAKFANREITDTAGNVIPSHWVATHIQALVTGRTKPFGQKHYGQFDLCDTDFLAGPDNLKYSAELRTLFISEDTSKHLNNFLWAWQVDTKQLTRILSVPAGGEVTGVQPMISATGKIEILANVQHPGAIRDLKKFLPKLPQSTATNRLTQEKIDRLYQQIDQRAIVGFLSTGI